MPIDRGLFRERGRRASFKSRSPDRFLLIVVTPHPVGYLDATHRQRDVEPSPRTAP